MEFGGDNVSHTDDVLSISFFNGEVKMVATGQKDLRPCVHIWSPEDPTICFSSFQLPNSCREVCCLCFDNSGRYIVAVGKDPKNSFFVFCIKTQSFIWTSETTENIIFDVKWNKTGEYFCLVGNKIIIYACLSIKQMRIIEYKDEKKGDEIFEAPYFTCVSYSNNNNWIIGDSKGKLSFWDQMNTLKDQKQVCENVIFALNTDFKHEFICCSDGKGNLYILKEKFYVLSIVQKLSFENNIVKGIDINSRGSLILGMKSSEIIYKELENNKTFSTKDTYINRSHYNACISDICIVEDLFFISIGNDNKIILWNISNKNVEQIGIIHEKIDSSELSKDDEQFQLCQQGSSLAYNKKYDHVVLGTKSSNISIRAGYLKLNKSIRENLILANNAISKLLSFSSDNEMLISSNTDNFMYVYSVRNNYSNIKVLTGMSSYARAIDWDDNNNYIQVVCKNNDYFTFNVQESKQVTDVHEVSDVTWNTITCKFGYYVQGVFLGNTDPNYINCVAKSNDNTLMISGDDDRLINIYNFPVISEHSKCKSY